VCRRCRPLIAAKHSHAHAWRLNYANDPAFGRGARWEEEGGGQAWPIDKLKRVVFETRSTSLSSLLSLSLSFFALDKHHAGRSFQGSCESETSSLSHQTAMNIRRFRWLAMPATSALISSDILTLPLIHPRLRVRLKFYTPRRSARANNQPGRLIRFAVSDSATGNRGVSRRVIAPPIYDRFHSFRGIAITSV